MLAGYQRQRKERERVWSRRRGLLEVAAGDVPRPKSGAKNVTREAGTS